jgi:hypothetical protein
MRPAGSPLVAIAQTVWFSDLTFALSSSRGATPSGFVWNRVAKTSWSVESCYFRPQSTM